MNINEIAAAAVDRIEPSLKKTIDEQALAEHPEIVNGRKVMIEKRDRMIKIVSMAISDAIVAAEMIKEKSLENHLAEK